jgi:hypothetical protein
MRMQQVQKATINEKMTKKNNMMVHLPSIAAKLG